jgi:hypothetical protein
MIRFKERTSSDLIGDSVVIFFDEPVDERDEPIERLIQRWNVTRANILSMVVCF